MAKPVVYRLQSQMGSKAAFIQVDVTSRDGIQLASRYGVRAVPTLLVLDRAARVSYQASGIPNSGAVLKAIEAAQ
jgi:hypothetical protein